MKIHINDIPEEGLELSANVDEDAWLRQALERVFEDYFLAGSQAWAKLKVDLINETVAVGGEVGAQLRPKCDRCLEFFDTSFECEVRQYLIPVPTHEVGESKSGEEIEIGEEDFQFGTYHKKTIDIAEILAEQLALERPIQFLCRESCRGLCVHCGINLNRSSCNCHEAHHQGQFAVLKTLKLGQNDG